MNIDDHLLHEAKLVAAQAHLPLGAVIDDALRLMLATRSGSRERKPVKLPIGKSGGLQPGVDLEDKEGLAELLGENKLRAAG